MFRLETICDSLQQIAVDRALAEALHTQVRTTPARVEHQLFDSVGSVKSDGELEILPRRFLFALFWHCGPSMAGAAASRLAAL